MTVIHKYWRRLIVSPAKSHDYVKLELLGVWKPPGSSRSLPTGEGKETRLIVFDGNNK
jgi:hypothetical protein